MRLTRWALAGASVYVIYRYTIGRIRGGEAVFTKPGGEERDTQPRRREARR